MASRAKAPLSWHPSSVQQPPVMLPGSDTPAYPHGRVPAGKRGKVVMVFDVDSLGRVDLASARATMSDDPAFTAAVRAVLGSMRFEPSRMVALECARRDGKPVFENRAPKCRGTPAPNGRPVRTRVTQEFHFEP